MDKLFVYDVNGTDFEDTVAFGAAWVQATALAKAEHCGIFRQVIYGENIRNEFFAKGGIFLAERFYHPDKLYIF